MTDQARNNTIENFKLGFDSNFLRTVISRMDENDALSPTPYTCLSTSES